MKRVCSVLLAVLMLLSTVTAFAADTTVKATAITVEKSVYHFSISDFQCEAINITVTFSSKSKYDDYEAVKAVSSNKKVVKTDPDWRSGSRKMTFIIYPKSLGTATITFKTKSGIKATCKVIVDKVYFLGIRGYTYRLKNIPSAKINGKTCQTWHSTDKKVVKTEKGTFKCLKADKNTALTKKVNGRTYKIYVLAKTKSDLLDMITPKAENFDNEHQKMLGEPQVYIKRFDNKYITSVHYYYKTDEYIKDGYGYYWCMWYTEDLCNSSQGLQIDSPAGEGSPCKKSDVGKKCTPQFGA